MVMPAAQLSELQIDALKEIGNIGAGNAATSLSQLLNTTIRLSKPSIDMVKVRDLFARTGYEERVVAMMHMDVLGEAPGQMVVLFDREHAFGFVSGFMRRIIGDIRLFDSIVESTLKMLVSITAGTYFTALQSLTNIAFAPSVPTLSFGTACAAFRSLLSMLPDEDVVLIESSILDAEGHVTGRIVLIPETGSLHALLAAFGVD